tara:strand:- start:366 stop:1190 length:825 start_codon:yes stop_codon:yes gene_type:complete
MNIIGLGKAGCAIATCLEEYPQYTCYKIDVGEEGKRCYNFPAYETTEEYEEKTPDLTGFFKDINEDVLFVLAGGGAISCASLNILQQLSSSKLSILYIQPELDLLNTRQTARERLVKGVLQEYARSGIFKRFYLISNRELENIIGDVPIVGYFDRLNKILSSTLHMINVFTNSEPLLGRIESPRDVCRISTFGLFDAEKNEEKMFFPLDKQRDICYIYGMNEERLQTDGSLFRVIMNQMKAKVTDTINISYAIFSTQYKEDISYCVSHTSHVQL